MNDRRRGSPDVESRRNAGTCLALAGLLSVGIGLFALTVVILPDLLKAVVFAAVLGGFVLLHYLTWGRWLARPRPGDVIDDQAEQGFPDRSPDEFADID